MTASHTSVVDPSSMVLVLVDLQERLAVAMENRDKVVSRAMKLARAAALVGAPIILTRQYPKGLGPVVPELESLLLELAHGGARVLGVDKMAFCCASEPTFRDALAATGRDQVVLTGMETHICVTQTALALLEDRMRIQVVADACCSRDREAHEIALARMRAEGIIITHHESVMYEAVGVAGTDEFRALLHIVKD